MTHDPSGILQSLNDKQKEAVSAPRGNLLVLAGAGSGKTRVLVHRIAWLVAVEKVAPQDILAVTFTNKAAGEIRERVGALLGGNIRHLWFGTFHHIAHRLLRRHIDEAGFKSDFQIIDADEQLRLVRKIIRDLNIDEQRWPAVAAAAFINRCKDEGQRARHKEPDRTLYADMHLKIYTAYEESCNLSGLVDFAELLLRSHELWLEQPQLLARYQERFQDLLVDEFQDTNSIQYAWLRVLAGDIGKVMVVGDDDQSIYGWRGAKVGNILSFEQEFPGVRTIRLEQNYRSTSILLDAANALIRNNVQRKGKNLWTQAGHGVPIRICSVYNEVDEAIFVARQIESWLRQGGGLSEVAVFYRSNAQSQVLEDVLVKFGLPYRIHGGYHFYKRAEIRDAIAYMRMLLTPHTDQALLRIINMPPRGVGEATIRLIGIEAGVADCSLWQAAMQLLDREEVKGRAAAGLATLRDRLAQLTIKARTQSLDEIAAAVVDGFELKEHHGRGDGEAPQARVENLRELVSACRRYQESEDLDNDMPGDQGGMAWLRGFIDQVLLGITDTRVGEFADVVQLMTLHACKGLEFPVAFMTGMEEGLFPRRSAFVRPGELEEERRLCYVGMTRAMRLLYMTHARSRRIHGRDVFNTRSNFLDEIPAELTVDFRQGHGEDTAPPMKASRPEASGGGVPASGAHEPSPGRRVLHPSFGEGSIVDTVGHGDQTKVQVHFAGRGRKWLVLRYARLEMMD